MVVCLAVHHDPLPHSLCDFQFHLGEVAVPFKYVGCQRNAVPVGLGLFYIFMKDIFISRTERKRERERERERERP